MDALGTDLLVALTLVAMAAVALVALAGLAALTPPGRRFWNQFRAVVHGRPALVMAAIVACVATAGSLFFSLGRGFIPCELCWYERIAMYPLVVILIVAAVRRDRWAWVTAAPFLVAGVGVTAWHLYLEANPGVAVCTQGVPCSMKWINELGFITIPTMAATAFVLISVLVALACAPLRGEPRGAGDSAATG